MNYRVKNIHSETLVFNHNGHPVYLGIGETFNSDVNFTYGERQLLFDFQKAGFIKFTEGEAIVEDKPKDEGKPEDVLGVTYWVLAGRGVRKIEADEFPTDGTKYYLTERDARAKENVIVGEAQEPSNVVPDQ